MKVFYLYFTINLINNCFFYFRTFFHLSAFFCMNRDLEPSILRWHLSTACIRFMFFVGKIFLFLLFFYYFFSKVRGNLYHIFAIKHIILPWHAHIFPGIASLFSLHAHVFSMSMKKFYRCSCYLWNTVFIL